MSETSPVVRNPLTEENNEALTSSSSFTCLPNEHCCVKYKYLGSKSEELTCVTKGLLKLVDYRLEIEDETFNKYLVERKSTVGIAKVHCYCQKEIYNMLKGKSNANDGAISNKVPKIVTRSGVSQSAWKENCFFCGKECKDKKNPSRNNFQRVYTLPFKESVLKTCRPRNDDEWALAVTRRISDCHDFFAAEARYHISCNERFSLGLSEIDHPSMISLGRPVDQSNMDTFDQLCDWLESEAELYSLSEH